jgi:hypothetical protein
MYTEKVIYQGKQYILIKKYDSGYCEIKKDEEFGQIILVPFSELTI